MSAGPISGTYGKLDERSVTAAVNVLLIEDRLAVRGAIQRSMRDGWLRDTITVDRYTIRARTGCRQPTASADEQRRAGWR